MINKFSLSIVPFVFGICFFFNSCKEKNRNEIKVTKREALEIAKRYDISGDNVVIFFKTYIYPKTSLAYKKGMRRLFYWSVSKECNHCSIIQIDAITGKVFSEGRYGYIY